LYSAEDVVAGEHYTLFFYQDRGYPVKNGPLDSVEELLLVKGWGPDILYGKEADEEGDAIYGIADLLTVWGDGKVNLNTASTDVLLSYAEYEDWELESVLEARNGEDGEPGTLDDGIKNLADVGADLVGKIKAGIPDAQVEMEDLAGDNDHWKAVVTSESFRGKLRVAQHQMVYAALGDRMGGELHALALETRVPAG